MNMETIKLRSDAYLDERMDELWELSKYIHANPELAFHEVKAMKALSDFLEKEGFLVERGVGTLDTAFKAEFTHIPVSYTHLFIVEAIEFIRSTR